MDREKGELDTLENSKRTAKTSRNNDEKIRERGQESRRLSQKSDLTRYSFANVNADDMPSSRNKKTLDECSRKPYYDVGNGINKETAETYCGIRVRGQFTERAENKSKFTTNNADSRVLNPAGERETPAIARSMRARTCFSQGSCLDNEESLQNEETVVFAVCACVSASSAGHQTGRVDLYVSDDRINIASFRKQHGIQNVIATKGLPVTNDSEAKVLVRLLIRGEDKDSWRHCETQDGEKAFPEEQRLDLAKILRHRSAFPVTAHWFLETPEKCPPSLHLEAVLQIQPVPRGVTSPIWDDSSEVITISVEVGD